jgi:hypothetical protein
MKMRSMEAFVIGLSSQRMYRDLFWHLASVAPLLLLVLLALVALPRHRRFGGVGLVFGAVGAMLVAVVFHYNYALAIWGTHDSAIRLLDTRAACAGFAAGSLVYLAGAMIYASAARLTWRATPGDGAAP